MAVKEKSKLKRGHQNFINHIKGLAKSNILPKYVRASIEKSVANNHLCENIDGYWVQLYGTSDKEFMKVMPRAEVLEELGMTEEQWFKRFPGKKTSLTK